MTISMVGKVKEFPNTLKVNEAKLDHSCRYFDDMVSFSKLRVKRMALSKRNQSRENEERIE